MEDVFKLTIILSEKEKNKQEALTYHALLRMVAGFCDLQEDIARRTINDKFKDYQRENLSQDS